MHKADRRAIAKLRAKLFANIAVMETFCHTMRAVAAESDEIETEDLSDRDLARMVQQWLAAAEAPVDIDAGTVSPRDVTVSFRVLEKATERLLATDFTLEERRALSALKGELTARIENTADPAPRGFWGRFWHALHSA